MADVTHPYNYRRAVLHEEAAPSSMAATPNLAEIAGEYAAGQARIAVQDEALKSDVAFAGKKLTEQGRQTTGKLAEQGRQFKGNLAEQGRQFTGKLTEQDRQFQDKLDMDRKMLDTWATQNRWATTIAIANLGIQGLAIPAQIKKQDRQDAILQEIVASGKRNVANVTATYNDRIAAQTKINADAEAEAAERLSEITAPPVTAEEIGELGRPKMDLAEAAALWRRNPRGH